MYLELSPTIDKTRADNTVNYLNEALIEKIWHDLDEQVSCEIRQIAAEVAVKFQNATVGTFLYLPPDSREVKTKPNEIG